MGRLDSVVAWMLVAVAFAMPGCADPERDVAALRDVATDGAPEGSPLPVDNATALTGLEAELGAVMLNRTPFVQDWFVLATTGTPEGALTGFSWSIPAGAAVPDRFDPASNVTVLGIAPIMDPEDLPKLEQWTLVMFVLRDGVAEARSTVSRGAWHWSQRDATGLLGGTGSGDEGPRDWATPLYAWIDYGRLDEGAQIAFVLGVRASSPAEFGLAFRVMDKDPEEEPPGDFNAVRATWPPAPPLALPRLGTGTGLALASYLDVSSLGIYAYEGYTPEIEVQRTVPNAARPTVSVQEVTLRFKTDFAQGWSLGYGAYYPYSGAGRWQYDLDLHGSKYAGGGVLAPTLVILAPGGYILTGLPYYEVTAEGGGPAAGQLHATGVNGPYLDFVYMEHLVFGSTLDELLVLPALPQFFTVPGALDGTDSAHGTRIIEKPGATLLLAPGGVIRHLPAASRPDAPAGWIATAVELIA